jgi:uncharacterized protein
MSATGDPDGRPYVRRVVDDELDLLLTGLPAISVEGAKAVGKTETALRRAATAFRLDDDAQRQNLNADPTRLRTAASPILIDEWQRLPSSWDIVRRAVDDDPAPGKWLLTGSAAPIQQPTHSGAGRIITLRMRPMTLAERGVGMPTVSLAALLSGGRSKVEGESDVDLAQYAAEIVASGFPGMRRGPDWTAQVQLDGYVDRIVERDFEELGGREVRNPAALRRWMTAYAAVTATTATYEVIRDAATSGEGAKPARTTTQPYQDVLQRLRIVEPVPAWLPVRNQVSRLVAPPKHQLVDPALAARLLGAGPDALLDGVPLGPQVPRDGTLLGHLFESLVTLDVRVYAQAARASVRHLRTRRGEHEIDLIVERDDHRILAIEVKLSRTIDDRDVRQLHWLADTIGDDLIDAVVVTTGSAAYRRDDGIAVVPLALLGA